MEKKLTHINRALTDTERRQADEICRGRAARLSAQNQRRPECFSARNSIADSQRAMPAV